MISFSKYIKFFLVLIIFFFGIFFERFDVKKKIIDFYTIQTQKLSQTFFSIFNQKKIYIHIDSDNFKKLLHTRNLAVNNTMLTREIEDWVSARLFLNLNSESNKIKYWYYKLKKEFQSQEDNFHSSDLDQYFKLAGIDENIEKNIRIRLKGVWPEHWEDENQWSFKVKFNNKNDLPLGYAQIAMQPPWTLDYIYEWLLSKALEDEGLIYLPVEYYEVVLNNDTLGLYTIQAQISDEILFNSKRLLGPIIGFTKDTWIKEQINSKKLYDIGAVDSLNSLEDTFWRSKIEPVRFEKYSTDTLQLDYLNKAIFLLESFRNGSLLPNKVFDVEKLASVMALRALLGSSEFDYLDTKFYYNPNSGLLEPITKEAHVKLAIDWKKYYYSWWIDSFKSRPHYINDTNYFLDLLYKDRDFYKIYLKKLNYYSQINFYKKLINKHHLEFSKNLNALNYNYPNKDVYSSEQLEINRLRIIDLINPVEGINAYYSNYKNNFLHLNIFNIQRLPLEILGIEFQNNVIASIEKPIFVEGKRPGSNSQKVNIAIKCDNILCNKKNIINQKVIFRILGQDKLHKAFISPYYTNLN